MITKTQETDNKIYYSVDEDRYNIIYDKVTDKYMCTCLGYCFGHVCKHIKYLEVENENKKDKM